MPRSEKNITASVSIGFVAVLIIYLLALLNTLRLFFGKCIPYAV